MSFYMVLWGGFPTPLFYMRKYPHTPLLRGYAPRSCGYFYETIKVAKSVFKRKGPLENLLWGDNAKALPWRGVTSSHTFSHSAAVARHSVTVAYSPLLTKKLP